MFHTSPDKNAFCENIESFIFFENSKAQYRQRFCYFIIFCEFLVRESIAYPYMDFQNSRISKWISMIFGCQFSIIHISVDIHINIKFGISMQGHSAMDISKQ